jgi:hypothetical protein
MLIVAMLNVVMLSVVAPKTCQPSCEQCHRLKAALPKLFFYLKIMKNLSKSVKTADL